MSGLIQVVATFTPEREPDRDSVYVVGQCSNTVGGVRRLLRRHVGGDRDADYKVRIWLGHWDGRDFIDMGWSPWDRPHFDSERRGWAADMLDGGTRDYGKDLDLLAEQFNEIEFHTSTPSEEDTNG
tara:strand:- start:1487 stop:1864 length:378 start_codon:yes stop_codon:yes gene_type:complete